MLGVSGIHELVRGRLEGTTSGDEVGSALLHEQVFLEAEVKGALNRSFSFVHARYFTFYGKEGVVTVAEDHTDSLVYVEHPETALMAHRNNDRYSEDSRRFAADGLQVIGTYVTHPVPPEKAKALRNHVRASYQMNLRPLQGRHQFPSSTDIETWLDDKGRTGYLFVGYKSNPDQQLKIHAYIPIAMFETCANNSTEVEPRGRTALRSMADPSILGTDGLITKSEFDQYCMQLRLFSIQSHVLDKPNNRIRENLILEVPLKIKGVDRGEQLLLFKRPPRQRRLGEDTQGLFRSDDELDMPPSNQ